jgi:methionine-rich copper-binding protein CopC
MNRIQPAKYGWLLLLLGAIAFNAQQASAHAIVTESSLRHHPIELQHATEVVLHFNAGVELALSRVFLVSEGDVYTPVEIAHGKKPGDMIIYVPPLAAGDYALKYKVFAADGHLTEDVIRFKVSTQR